MILPSKKAAPQEARAAILQANRKAEDYSACRSIAAANAPTGYAIRF